MVEVADAVVAEQVGVGEHDHAAQPVLGHRRQRAPRRCRLGRGPRDHAGAVADGERPGPVEAGLGDPRQRVGPAAALPVGPDEVGQDPARRLAVVRVVLDGRRLDLDPEAGEQLVQVVPVLLLLGLAEHDQPAARLHPGGDRLDLLVRQPRFARPRGRLPTRVGGMGDDEDVGARERVRVERPVVVGGDREVAPLQQPRRALKRSVGRMRLLHPLGELGVDRPGLRVGFVEEDAGAGGCGNGCHTAPQVSAPSG